MEKIRALKEANVLLSQKIKSLTEATEYKSNVLYHSSNNETSISIYSIVGGQKSNLFIENEFQRIICIAGEIKITLFNGYNEDITLTSSNTILIPPNTKYTVETKKNSEVIVVYKPKKEIKEKVLVKQTIYN